MKNRLFTFALCLGLFCFAFANYAFAGDVTIHVTKSDGSDYQGVQIHYLDGYWKNFGTTDGSGIASLTIPDGTYDFKASIGGTQDIQNLVVNGTTNGSFQTSKVTIQVRKSDNSVYQGVATHYHSGYWRSIGNTDSSGEASIEIFDGTYDFKASVGGTESVQNVEVDGTTKISFQTSNVTVQVTKSDNAAFAGVATHYHSGYWRSIGTTDSNGEASTEIFDGTFDFRASVGGTQAVQNDQVVNGATVVPFQTSLGTFIAKTSAGDPLEGVSMHYLVGYWRSVGTTGAGGTTTTELFPGTYPARASLGGTSAVQSITFNSPGTVTFYTTEVTAKAEDCDNGNPISGVSMHYHVGYWRSIGNTDGSGETSIQLFPDDFDFRGSIGGTSATQAHTVPGDGATAGVSTMVTFSPTRVELDFGGSVKYLIGYWRTLSNPGYLFPGTYDFRFGDHVESLTISGCELSGNVYVFKTLKADGSPLPNIPIARNDYGNHYVSVGTTDANGTLFITTLPDGDWKYRASKNHTAQHMTSGPAVITFQTARFIVHAKKSDCTTDFEGIAAAYNDYGNHYLSMGNTDVNGQADIELFPGNYKFRASKNHTAKTGYLNLPTSGMSGAIELQTSKYIVHVKKADGTDFPGIAASFNDYGNHYLSMGHTDANGKAEIELFPGNRGFRAYKNHTANTGYLDIPASCSEDVIVFQTALVTGFARDCDSDSPIQGIAISFNDYGNHYLSMGNTDAQGKAYIELFPGNDYVFRGSTIHTSENKTVDLPASGVTVEFNPTRVCFQYAGTVKYNDYGNHWLTIPCHTYMFSGTYDFRFYSSGNPTYEESIAISGCSMEKSAVVMKLLDSNGDGLEGGIGKYNVGGWQTAGTTDANGEVVALINGLHNTIAFRMYWEGTSVQKNQNISTNSIVVFQTVLVTMNLKSSTNTDLAGVGKVNSGGWKTVGTTPNATKELLPKTYAFRMYYEGTSVQKNQNVAADPNVVFQTTLVTMKLLDATNSNAEIGGAGLVNSGGWITFGSGTTTTTMELLPKTYAFRVSYSGDTKQKNQNVGSNSTVIFTWDGGNLSLAAPDRELADLVPTNRFSDIGNEVITGEPEMTIFPNPVRTQTTIDVTLVNEENVQVAIFNLNGQLVDVIHRGTLPMGEHRLSWDASAQPAGNYLVRIQGEEVFLTKRISVVK